MTIDPESNVDPVLDAEDAVVERYCEIGSVSAAQYRGCVDHVTLGDVMELDTPAARQALDEVREQMDDGSVSYP